VSANADSNQLDIKIKNVWVFCNTRVAKRRQNGKIEGERLPVRFLAHRLGRLTPKIENRGGNACRTPRLLLGRNAVTAAASVSAVYSLIS
jgi:hypothetical protein